MVNCFGALCRDGGDIFIIRRFDPVTGVILRKYDDRCEEIDWDHAGLCYHFLYVLLFCSIWKRQILKMSTPSRHNTPKQSAI